MAEPTPQNDRVFPREQEHGNEPLEPRQGATDATGGGDRDRHHGDGVALRLLGTGMQLDVWSRHATSTEPLVDAGASASDKASDAVAQANVVITMLPNAEVTTDVMIGEEVLGAMPPKSTCVQMATIGAEATERLVMETRNRRPDVTFVDAPVSGSRDPAEKGQLLILASGPPGADELLDPVFAVLGRAILWLGAAGVGSRMKLALNTWLAFQVEGAAEVAALATHLGIPVPRLMDAFVGTPSPRRMRSGSSPRCSSRTTTQTSRSTWP